MEEDALDAWRNPEPGTDAIKNITGAIEEHVDYTDAAHDDIVDFITALKLANLKIGTPSRSTKTRTAVANATEESIIMPKIEERTLEPQPAPEPQAEPQTEPRFEPPKGAHYGAFMDSASIYENSYVVGNEISYYGCDTICSVNA